MVKVIIITIIALVLWVIFEKLQKLQISKSAERTVNKLLADIKEGKSKEVSLEDKKYGVLEVFDNGFQLSKTEKALKSFVEWSNVSEIYVFKRDLYTTDLICLGWKMLSTNEIVEIHEEMLGFKNVCEIMIEKFETIPVTWYMDVAHPAFETNMTLLWSKIEKS